MNSKSIVYILSTLICSSVFVIFGTYALKKKGSVHFWAGSVVKDEEIKDVKAYNRANAFMWLGAGAIIAFSGFASLIWKSKMISLVFVLLIFFIIIIMMVLYQKIYNKYKAWKAYIYVIVCL